MSRRGRRIGAALAASVFLLFAGRWTAGLLADRWWAAQISPSAVRFLTDWHLLRLTLDAAGVLVASAWFVGHMLLVYRAVGSVQVRRHVANLEFREALTPGALLSGAVATGVALGLLVGGGTSGWWGRVALAWQGVTYEITEPYLGRDIGVYVAQLPLWRAAHAFLVLLVVVGIAVAFGLYLLVGAVRWSRGRPAINGHARSHLGWLLAALALALAWGYALEPFEAIAGVGGRFDAKAWRALQVVSPVLAGVALATALLSALWATRPRHALVAAGWIVLAGASIVGHWLVPPAREEAAQADGAAQLSRLDRAAYGLEALEERRLDGTAAAPPALPSLWSAPAVSHLVAGDTAGALWADQAPLPVGRQARPAWLALRLAPAGRLAAYAVADDRLASRGEPLFYRGSDSVARPVPIPFLDLPPAAARPDAPRLVVGDGLAGGVWAAGWARRLVLAWALQSASLLGAPDAGSRVAWRLSPSERVERLAPFAEWTRPEARIVDGALVWLLDGYLPVETFPLSRRLDWRGRTIGSLRAAFLATVAAMDGATHVYLRPGADPVAEAWAASAAGVVESPSSIPEQVLDAAAYPSELLRTQAQLIEGRAVEGPPGAPRLADAEEAPRAERAWAADTTGMVGVVPLEAPGERRVRALLLGTRDEGRDVTELVRLDSATSLPARAVLEARWSRFPSFDAMSDSLREAGARLERGPVRYAPAPGGLVAYQPYYARAAGGTALVWVSVAAGERLGAGRTLSEAWGNLLGAVAPSLVGGQGAGVDRLDVARRWLLRADSAVRAGDWAGFGRAWSGLRGALGVPQRGGR